MEAKDVDVLSKTREHEPVYSTRDSDGKILCRRACPKQPTDFVWDKQLPSQQKSKRYEMPPQIPPPLPTDVAAPQPPEPAAPSEHRSKDAATMCTSFPLKGFTNLATPCAGNQLEVTRVKKSTLSAAAQTSDDQPEQKRRRAVHTRKRPAANAGVDDNRR